MNEDKKIEQLEKMLSSIGEGVDAREHRTALRAALLREHARRQRPYFTASALKNYITMKTALIPVSTFAILALIVVGTLGITHKSAEAQELVQRSMAAAAKLTPEMRAQIETNIKADMMKTLEEAYKAPDLRILTADEYAKEAQFTISTSTGPHGTMMKFAHTIDAGTGIPGEGPETVAFSGGASVAGVEGVPAQAVAFKAEGPAVGEDHDVVFNSAAPQGKFTTGKMMGAIKMNPPVKYLRYTDPDGRKVTLGLDEKDTPVFLIEEFTSKDMVPGPDGTLAPQGAVIRQLQVHAEDGGGFGVAGSVHVESSEMGNSENK